MQVDKFNRRCRCGRAGRRISSQHKQITRSGRRWLFELISSSRRPRCRGGSEWAARLGLWASRCWMSHRSFPARSTARRSPPPNPHAIDFLPWRSAAMARTEASWRDRVASHSSPVSRNPGGEPRRWALSDRGGSRDGASKATAQEGPRRTQPGSSRGAL